MSPTKASGTSATTVAPWLPKIKLEIPFGTIKAEVQNSQVLGERHLEMVKCVMSIWTLGRVTQWTTTLFFKVFMAQIHVN